MKPIQAQKQILARVRLGRSGSEWMKAVIASGRDMLTASGKGGDPEL
jgi:hypothetical protein